MSVHSYQWKQVRKRVLERDNHTCTWCGNSEGKMEVDHIIPRAKNGEMYDLGNLQTLCQTCHIIKTKKDSVFWSKKSTHAIPSSFSLQKGRLTSTGTAMRAIEGDSEAFGLGEAGE